MDRNYLQRLARERLQDAKALLGRKRWGCAYYICGYALECGLKACLLRYLGESEAVFADPTYLRRLQECWTHDLEKLIALAGLTALFGNERGQNADLERFWVIAKDWKETTRYDQKSEAEAKAILEAVGDSTNGVLQWIQKHW